VAGFRIAFEVDESKVNNFDHTRLVFSFLSTTRELPKKATKVKFTKDGETILVSDKFGDVFRYFLQTLLVLRFLHFI